jgi:AraC-like DNA-binding protein
LKNPLHKQPLLFGNESAKIYTSSNELISDADEHFNQLIVDDVACLYKYSDLQVKDLKITSELLTHIRVDAIVKAHSLLIALDGSYTLNKNKRLFKAQKNQAILLSPTDSIPLSSSANSLTRGLLINFELERLMHTYHLMRGVERLEIPSLKLLTLLIDKTDFKTLILAWIRQINGFAGDVRLLELNGFDDQFYRLLSMMMKPEYFLTVEPTRKDQLRIKNKKDFVHLIEHYVESKMYEPVNITELQAALGLSARGLQYAMNKYFGCAPRQYFYNKKLDRAYDLLSDKTTEMSVLEVSTKLGFSSQSRFSKFFLQRFGLKPSEVKNE